MKRFRLMSLVLALTVLFTLFAIYPVSAAEEAVDTEEAEVIEKPQLDDDTAVITVSGSISGAKAGDSVSVFIVPADGSAADASDWTKDDFLANVSAFVQTTAGADGKYSAELGMKGKEVGDYTIFVSAKGETASMPFFFADKESKTAFIGEVADIVEKSGSDETLAAELKDKLSLTGADSEVAKTFNIIEGDKILTVDQDNLALIFLTILKDEGSVETLEPSEFVELLSIAAALETVNDGSVNITEYKELFNLDKDFLNTYEEYVSDKDEFNTFTKGKDLKSVEEAQKLFCDSVCLDLITNAKSWSSYSVLIEEHGEYMEIDTDTYDKIVKKENVTNYLTGNYKTIEDFKTAANSAIKKVYDRENPPKGGGGTGGGGGGGGFSSKPTDAVSGDLTTPPVPLDEISGEPEFTDVDDSYWGKESIIELAKRGILSGTGDGMFEPEREITREEFVKIIVLSLGLAPSATSAEFTDLEEGAWYQGYIVAAVETGIVNGISETEFGLGLPVSRQDAATMIYRAALWEGFEFTGEGEAFADDANIADYAKEGIYALAGDGIINGVGDGMFDPISNCSRAESAKMVYELIKKGEGM